MIIKLITANQNLYVNKHLSKHSYQCVINSINITAKYYSHFGGVCKNLICAVSATTLKY